MKYDDKGNFTDLSDREVVGTARRWSIGLIVLVILLSILVPLGVWAFNVATSNVKGKGDATIIKNSAVNRIGSQAQFHDDFESIRALDQKLSDAQLTLDAFNKQHPSVGSGTAFDPMAEQQNNLQTSATGIKQQCRNVVARYDASTEQYTAKDFRDADLPYKIRENDPIFAGGKEDFSQFDCQPTSSK